MNLFMKEKPKTVFLFIIVLSQGAENFVFLKSQDVLHGMPVKLFQLPPKAHCT